MHVELLRLWSLEQLGLYVKMFRLICQPLHEQWGPDTSQTSAKLDNLARPLTIFELVNGFFWFSPVTDHMFASIQPILSNTSFPVTMHACSLNPSAKIPTVIHHGFTSRSTLDRVGLSTVCAHLGALDVENRLPRRHSRMNCLTIITCS